jgi:site-specific recombinase XerD
LLSCKLSEQAQAIVKRYSKPDHDPEDYIFPIFDRQVHTTEQQKFNRIVKSLHKVNSALKEIGKEIGLQFPLTTYVARHTFATVLKRSGVSVALISESLGHSDLSTTQIYLDSFENEQIDQAMRNLL